MEERKEELDKMLILTSKLQEAAARLSTMAEELTEDMPDHSSKRRMSLYRNFVAQISSLAGNAVDALSRLQQNEKQPEKPQPMIIFLGGDVGNVGGGSNIISMPLQGKPHQHVHPTAYFGFPFFSFKIW